MIELRNVADDCNAVIIDIIKKMKSKAKAKKTDDEQSKQAQIDLILTDNGLDEI